METHQDSKLQEAFYRRFRELAFVDRKLRDAKSWRLYLRSVGCFQAPDDDFEVGDGCEILHDPSPFGGHIIVPKDIALKLLALGLP